MMIIMDKNINISILINKRYNDIILERTSEILNTLEKNLTAIMNPKSEKKSNCKVILDRNGNPYITVSSGKFSWFTYTSTQT